MKSSTQRPFRRASAAATAAALVFCFMCLPTSAALSDDTGWLDHYSNAFAHALPLRTDATLRFTVWIEESEGQAIPVGRSAGPFAAVITEDRRRVECRVVSDPPGGPAPEFVSRTVYDGQRHITESGETGEVHVGTDAAPNVTAFPPDPFLICLLPFLPPDITEPDSGVQASASSILSSATLDRLGSSLILTDETGSSYTYQQADDPSVTVAVTTAVFNDLEVPTLIAQSVAGIELARIELTDWKINAAHGRNIYHPSSIVFTSLSPAGHPEVTLDYREIAVQPILEPTDDTFVLDTEFSPAVIDHDAAHYITSDPTLPPIPLPEPDPQRAGVPVLLIAVPAALLIAGAVGALLVVKGRS